MRVHAVVREEGYLFQGLLGLPIGLWLVVVLVAGLLWPELREAWGSLPGLLLLPVAIAGRYAIKRYYQAKGEVPQSAFANAAGSWVFVLGLLAISWGFGLAVSLESGIAVQGVWFGLAFLVFGRRFPVHVVLGVMLLIVSLILPFALSGVVSLSTLWSMLWLLLGCAVIVGSVYEHIVFVRRDVQSQ